MKRFPLFVVLLMGGFLLMGADGCSSDPNVEGAKLDLNNKDYDRALENIQTALERNPDNPEAYYIKGQVLQDMVQNEKQDMDHREQLVHDMVDSYQRAIDLDPELASDVSTRLQFSYVTEFQAGTQAYNRGQTDESAFGQAARHFMLAGVIEPDSVDAFVNEGFAYLQTGDQDKAIEPLAHAVDLGKPDEQTYDILSRLYLQTEQPEKAVTLLENAIDMFPESDNIEVQLLNAYIAAGMEDRAMQRYENAVEREPNNKLYRYNYGTLLLQSGKDQEAIEQFMKAVEIDPDYGSAQYNLGAAYINQAVDLNDQIKSLDEEAQSGNLSEEEKKAKNDQVEQLIEQRRQVFLKAIPYLEKALDLIKAEGGETSDICHALFTAYANTNQSDKAEAVAECAGLGDIN